MNLKDIIHDPHVTRWITEVIEYDDGYSIDCSSSSFFLHHVDAADITPKIGDRVHLWVYQGSFIRGVAIDNKVCYYWSVEEMKQFDEMRTKQKHKGKLAMLEQERADRDARIAKMPEVFQKRLKGYHEAGGDEWRAEYEPYELFCCEQATQAAEYFREMAKLLSLPSGASIEEHAVDLLTEWKYKSFDEQVKEWPGLSDKHTRNSFNCMCIFAKFYLVDPKLIEKLPGALAPIVGSKAYCDWSTRPGNQEEMD